MNSDTEIDESSDIPTFNLSQKSKLSCNFHFTEIENPNLRQNETYWKRSSDQPTVHITMAKLNMNRY